MQLLFIRILGQEIYDGAFRSLEDLVLCIFLLSVRPRREQASNVVFFTFDQQTCPNQSFAVCLAVCLVLFEFLWVFISKRQSNPCAPRSYCITGVYQDRSRRRREYIARDVGEFRHCRGWLGFDQNERHITSLSRPASQYAIRSSVFLHIL